MSPRRFSDTPVLTSRTDSRAPQTASYDDAPMSTQASAPTAMPSSACHSKETSDR
jgi:hypothetical protein